MPTWPSTLPQGLSSGASDKRQKGFKRTQTSTGPGRSRRRFSATSRFIKGHVLMSKAQRETFEQFYATDLSEGSLEFDWKDPIDQSDCKYLLVEPANFVVEAGDDNGVKLWKCNLHLELLP